MNNRKNFLHYLAQAIDQYRAERHVASVEEAASRAQPGRMRRFLRWLMPNGGTLLVVVLLILTQNVWARRMTAPTTVTSAVATTVNYQGHLEDSDGNPLNDTVSLSFAIYDAAMGGNVIWGPETHTGVNVRDGLFSVGLGTIQPLSADVWAGGDRYLEIAVNGQTLSPREPIRAVPFAQMAWTVPDGSITTNKIADRAVTDIWYVAPRSTARTSSTAWVDVQDTFIDFFLTHPAKVFFTYTMNVQAGKDVGSDILGTRLAVDGIPYASSGNQYQPHTSAAEWGNSDVNGSLVLPLNAGSHTVTLQWRTEKGNVTWSSEPTQIDGYMGARTITVIAFYR